jgi:hypothetical protein
MMTNITPLIKNVSKYAIFTSIPKSARLTISAHVLVTQPSKSITSWLKLKSFTLNAIIETFNAVK